MKRSGNGGLIGLLWFGRRKKMRGLRDSWGEERRGGSEEGRPTVAEGYLSEWWKRESAGGWMEDHLGSRVGVGHAERFEVRNMVSFIFVPLLPPPRRV